MKKDPANDPDEIVVVELLEVVATKDGKHYLSLMTSDDWHKLRKKAGYIYIAYRLRLSQVATESVNRRTKFLQLAPNAC